VEHKETILTADDDENDVLLLKMAFTKAGLADQLQVASREHADVIAIAGLLIGQAK